MKSFSSHISEETEVKPYTICDVLRDIGPGIRFIDLINDLASTCFRGAGTGGVEGGWGNPNERVELKGGPSWKREVTPLVSFLWL